MPLYCRLLVICRPRSNEAHALQIFCMNLMLQVRNFVSMQGPSGKSSKGLNFYNRDSKLGLGLTVIKTFHTAYYLFSHGFPQFFKNSHAVKQNAPLNIFTPS